MKRSATVPLTLVAAGAITAGGLAACAQEPAAESLSCVEGASGRVVPDSLCRAAGAARPVSGTVADSGRARTHSGGVFPAFFGWYYGGRIINGLARGGSYAPVAGRSYRSGSGSFLGASATRSGAPVRPSVGGAFAGGAASNARSTPARGGFGGTAAGRSGGG